MKPPGNRPSRQRRVTRAGQKPDPDRGLELPDCVDAEAVMACTDDLLVALRSVPIGVVNAEMETLRVTFSAAVLRLAKAAKDSDPKTSLWHAVMLAIVEAVLTVQSLDVGATPTHVAAIRLAGRHLAGFIRHGGPEPEPEPEAKA